MRSIAGRHSALCRLIGALTVGCAALSVHGQQPSGSGSSSSRQVTRTVSRQGNGNFRVAAGAYNRGQRNGAISGGRAGFYAGRTSAPVWGGGVYAPNYGDYSAGGYLSGAADVISAQGNFMIAAGQYEQLHEQRKQMKIQTQRQAFDEWLYERQMRPTAEDERERQQHEFVRRARNDPPASEIWSGNALNTLLVNIQKVERTQGPGPTVPIDETILPRINVTSGANAGSVGLLRAGGKLQWPLLLKGDDYDDDRQQIDKLMRQAYGEAQAGAVQADTLNGLNTALEQLTGDLKRNIRKVSSYDYINAKRYLGEVQSTIRTLQDPNVSNYVTRKWAAQGSTVGELVRNLTKQGLHFAPATQGDETAYSSLYNAMATYDVQMDQLASSRGVELRTGPPGPPSPPPPGPMP
jgi:hypothetical protein